MPDMSSPIMGSGIDAKSISEQLAIAEITPTKNRLDKMESSYISTLSSLGMIKSSLGKLQTLMNTLSNLTQLYRMQTTISDTTAFTAEVDTTATPGNYQIQVTTLAAQQTLASNAFASPATVVGDGTLTITFGTYSNNNSTFTINPNATSLTLTIGPGQDSLQAIQNAINNSSSGVKASIIQDNSGARLTLTSPQTGQNYAMQITTSNPALAALTYDPTTGNTGNLQQTMAAADSQIQFNGLTLTQGNNQYTNIINGVTINLLKANPGSTVNLTIQNDQDNLKNMVRNFVKQYNETLGVLNDMMSYDPETKKSGIMQGDADIRNLKFALNSLVSNLFGNPNSPVKSLADIGIKSSVTPGKQGILSIDETVLGAAVEANYQAIGSLFAKTGMTTDSGVRVKSIGPNIAAGSYSLVLSSFIPGSSLSGTINGVPATSTDGYTLQGGGNLDGLVVDILGGGTGYRGNIIVTDGIAVQLNNFINQALADDGNLTNKTDSLNERVKAIDIQKENLADHAEAIRKRYFQQFSRLDVLLVSMQSTSNFLNQQLSRLSDLTKR